ITSFKWPRIFSFIPLWKWFLTHRKYDAVISAVEFVNVFTIIAHRLSFQNASLITTTRTDLGYELDNNYSKKLKIVFKLAHFLYPYADHCVSVSDGVAKSMREVLLLPNDLTITTIYNPAAKETSFTLKPQQPHPWFGEEAPIIIGCGRLTEQKDFSLLIDAFSETLKTCEAKLIILGNGPLKETLEEQIKALRLEDKSTLVGNINNPEAFMFHAQLFVLSSLWEGFGNVIVESFSVGCPVVSMNCPSGPAEIFENGKYGTLVEQRTKEALAKAITSALSQKRQARKTLKKRAKDFTAEKIVQKYLALIMAS
ncbi:MAG: glycosyltransferase, partial [Alphaproteobacteria bacterium]